MERSPVPISLKRKIKYLERPEIPEKELEIDHIDPHGGNDRENLMALTLIEHATKHYQMGEFNAVNLIISRMSDSEFKVWCRVRRTL